MLLGYARGKVGDLVFSRSNGQQVVRARATQVKNPQTETQMIQRIILNTVAQAYSRFKSICDHSFEGINGNQKSMSYFMRRNIDNLRGRVQRMIADNYDTYSIYAFTPVNSSDYAPNEFILSKGTLPEITAGFAVGNVATMALSANTYAAVIADYGLQRGDQITFITTQGSTGANTSFNFARVILDPTNADGTQASLETPFIVDGAINLPNERNEGAFANLTFADNTAKFNFSAQTVTGAAIIVSRKNYDGSWLRSNSILQLNETGLIFQQSLGECLYLLQGGEIDAVDGRRYLNNAGIGAVASSNMRTVTIQDGDSNNITLVSLQTMTVHKTSGEPAVTTESPLVVATDSNGIKHWFKCDMLNAEAYGLYLTNGSAYNAQAFTLNRFDEQEQEGWAESSIGITAPTGDLWTWLHSNGVSENIFLAPVYGG